MTVLSNVTFVNTLRLKKSSWSPIWPSNTQVSVCVKALQHTYLPDLCIYVHVVCALLRGEAILLHYVSLYDKAQEEFTPACAVSSP